MATEPSDVDKSNITRLIANSDRLIEAFTKAGVAYIGYGSARSSEHPSGHWTGALTALIALKLATGGNLAGGVAGTGVLALMGLDRITPRYTTVGGRTIR